MSCHRVPNFLNWFSLFHHDLPCCCSINQWFPFLSFTKENFTGKFVATYWHSTLRPAELLVPGRGFTGGNLSWSGEASPACHSRALGVKTGFLMLLLLQTHRAALGEPLSLSVGCVIFELQLMWNGAEMPAGILAAVDVGCRWTRYFPVSDVCETTRQSFLKPLIYNVSFIILMWTGCYAKYY